MKEYFWMYDVITNEREVEEVKDYILKLVKGYFEEMRGKPNTKELRDRFAEYMNLCFESDGFQYYTVCDETTNPHNIVMNRAIGFNVIPNEGTVVCYDNQRKFCFTVGLI